MFNYRICLKNDTRDLSYIYKYTRKGSIAKEAHESHIINSVIISYYCKLNQDITKAHLSKYKLFSESCPMLGIRGPDAYCTPGKTRA